MTRYQGLQTIARFALILASIVIVQGILSFRFPVFAYFDLPLIYSIYYGFSLAKPSGSVALGSVLGLMQDSLSGVALGTNAFTKTLIGFLSAIAGGRFDVDQTLTRVLALTLFTILDSVLKVVLGVLVRPAPVEASGWSLGTLVLSAGFNVLVGLVLFGYGSRYGHATA
jgi:rod shape-determining protein MreD